MQRTSESATSSLHVPIVASAVVILALSGTLAAQSGPDAEAAYHRALSIGTTDAVHAAAENQAQAHHMSWLLLHHERAEVGAPPPACGLMLGQRYRRALRERFSVIALDTCRESNLSVDCPSETLGSESQIFLRLTYSYKVDREMNLGLSAYHRNLVGATTATQVPRESKLTFAELWDELTEVARTCPAGNR